MQIKIAKNLPVQIINNINFNFAKKLASLGEKIDEIMVNLVRSFSFILLVFISNTASAKTAHTNRPTVICADVSSTKMLNDLDDPRRGSDWFSSVFQRGECMWFAANVTFNFSYQDLDTTQLSLPGTSKIYFVKNSAIDLNVGAEASKNSPETSQTQHFDKSSFDKNIADIQASLGITPMQQPLFDAYVKEWLEFQMQDFAASQKILSALPKMDLIERVRLRQETMRLVVNHVERQLDVLIPLYESFSPEQKMQADKLLQ